MIRFGLGAGDDSNIVGKSRVDRCNLNVEALRRDDCKVARLACKLMPYRYTLGTLQAWAIWLRGDEKWIVSGVTF